MATNLNSEAKKRLYLNTLVFCLIGGVVSLGLLAMLVYGGGTASGFVPFIVTVELGLLSVLIYAFVVLVRNESMDRQRAANAADNKIAAKVCPDYWTLSSDPTDNTKDVCVRRYIAPATTDGPGATTSVFVVQGSNETINLSEFDNQKLSDVCTKVRAQNTPWTDLRTICDAYKV